MNTLRRAVQTEGYCIVRSLLSPAAVSQWRSVIGAQLEATGKAQQRSGVAVWWPQDVPELLLAAHTRGAVAAVAAAILGPRAEFLSAKPVIKDHSRTFATPFHADTFYWGGSTKISCWLALDAARRTNGCLTLVLGTHRQLDRLGRVSLPQAAKGFEHRIADAAVAASGLPVVDVELAAGDSVWFLDSVVHGSQPNSSQQPRWSFISTFRDGAVPDSATIWPDGGQACVPAGDVDPGLCLRDVEESSSTISALRAVQWAETLR